MVLFDVLAEADAEDDTSAALLRSARELSWPILALLAACYSGAPQLQCLAVWLRTTLDRSQRTSGDNLTQ